MNDKILLVTIGFLSLVPFVAYLDYYLLKKKAICEKCGYEPDKHAWLLATVLEAFLFLVGILVGIGIN